MVLIIYRRIRLRYQRVVRSRKSEERQHNNGQKKKDKGQTMIYKTPHRKQKLNNKNPH
jgi:hypothetical protein